MNEEVEQKMAEHRKLTKSGKRWCAYAQEAIMDPDNPTLHMVAFVTEGEAGYDGTTYAGDLAYCEAVAADINTTLGYDRDAVLEIVASSFAAQNQSRALGWSLNEDGWLRLGVNHIGIPLYRCPECAEEVTGSKRATHAAERHSETEAKK